MTYPNPKRLHKLADYIETVSPETFEMSSLNLCLVPHGMSFFSLRPEPLHGAFGQGLQNHLGLTDEERDELFISLPATSTIPDYSPAQAAHVLRHFADTGEIIWSQLNATVPA